MKLCKRCFMELDKDGNIDANPVRKLGEIFISNMGNVDIDDICPECREELGVMNLMGFRS